MNPIEDIRNVSRDSIILKRRNQRQEMKDCRRNYQENSLHQQNLIDILAKLKTSSSVSVNELNFLKNTLFEDLKCIEVFLSMHGALRGLIREFTGMEANKQCEAAACLCNLALGDSKACHSVAKSTGTYLVASLDSLNIDLAVTSAWTIGNLAGSGIKTCEVLISQGAVSKLTEKLIELKIEDMRDAVVYALEHVVYNMKDSFSDEAIQKMFQALKQIQNYKATSKLLFLISCHPKFTNLESSEECFVETLLDIYVNEAQTVIHNGGEQLNHYNFVYITRTLANMSISTTVCDKMIHHLINNGGVMDMPKLYNSEIESVRNSTTWLLGNLYNFSSNNSNSKNIFLDFCHNEEQQSALVT